MTNINSSVDCASNNELAPPHDHNFPLLAQVAWYRLGFVNIPTSFHRSIVGSYASTVWIIAPLRPSPPSAYIFDSKIVTAKLTLRGINVMKVAIRKCLVPWSFHWITCSPKIYFSIIFKNNIWETTCWCITTSDNINRIFKRNRSDDKRNSMISIEKVFLPVINKITHEIESCC